MHYLERRTKPSDTITPMKNSSPNSPDSPAKTPRELDMDQDATRKRRSATLLRSRSPAPRYSRTADPDAVKLDRVYSDTTTIHSKRRPGVGPRDVPQWAGYALLLVVVACGVVLAVLAPQYTVMTRPGLGEFVNYILMATPLFFVLMAAEIMLIEVVHYNTEGAQYSLSDSWNSISAGLTQQLIDSVRRGLDLDLLPYLFVYTHYAPVQLSEFHWLTWAIPSVGVDFLYYFLHRFGHTNAMLWNGHSVHHSSDSYNLSTALRQSWVQSATSWVLYLPLALLGVPPRVMVVSKQWNALFQFWVHTCIIRRLPAFFEYIFMTPSHHRVHHDRRVHKNYAGVFVVFDRMFGTFLDETVHTALMAELDQAETEEQRAFIRKSIAVGGTLDNEEICVFGTTQNPGSYTDVVTQSFEWMRLFRRAARVGLSKPTRWLSVLVFGPGYYTTQEQRTLAPPKRATRLRLQSTTVSSGGKAYMVVHFALLIFTGTVFNASKETTWANIAAWMLPTLFGLFVQGLLWDGNENAVGLELLRCVVTSSLSFVYLVIQVSLDRNPAADFRGTLIYVIFLVHLTSVIILATDGTVLKTKFSFSQY